MSTTSIARRAGVEGRASPPSAGSVSRRRAVQCALALLWLLDAALQYQPYMYTAAFPRSLAASAAGNPAPIADPIGWTAGQLAHHLAPANTAFATIQLLIAIGLLWPRSVKAALTASIAWSLGVWWFGEGLGGLLAGANPISGFPGAAILYALLALLAWPCPAGGLGRSVATSGPLGKVFPRVVWTALWASFAYLEVRQARNGHGPALWIAITAAYTIIAVSVWSALALKPGLMLAVVVAAGIWVAQGFGAILTGQSTDPNTGPLLILLAFAYWPEPTGAAISCRRLVFERTSSPGNRSKFIELL